jgi:hypothetical protein
MPDMLGETIGNILTAFGYDGTAFRNLTTDAAGHLQVDALTSGLPAGAATQATLALVLAELTLLADLTNALQSVAADRLLVRGEDQLVSYKNPLLVQKSGAVSGAGGYYDSTAVAAGEVWRVDMVQSTDQTSATTGHRYSVRRGGANYTYDEITAALALNVAQYTRWPVWLEAGDVIRVTFLGSLVADVCLVRLFGQIMTKEV